MTGTTPDAAAGTTKAAPRSAKAQPATAPAAGAAAAAARPQSAGGAAPAAASQPQQRLRHSSLGAAAAAAAAAVQGLKQQVSSAGASDGQLHLVQVLPACLAGRALVWGNALALKPEEWGTVDAPYFAAPGGQRRRPAAQPGCARSGPLPEKCPAPSSGEPRAAALTRPVPAAGRPPPCPCAQAPWRPPWATQ